MLENLPQFLARRRPHMRHISRLNPQGIIRRLIFAKPCKSAPRDDRLVILLAMLSVIAILYAHIDRTTDAFGTFARKLKTRRLSGGPDSYDARGPQELFEIVETVNSYLQDEREQLANRAVVLSGVSHDLGTPATRMRSQRAKGCLPRARGQYRCRPPKQC